MKGYSKKGGMASYGKGKPATSTGHGKKLGPPKMIGKNSNTNSGSVG